MSPNCEQTEKQPVECNKENEVQVQGIKRKEAGSSSKRNKSGLEQNKNKSKKGQATMYKSGNCASASSEGNPSFNVQLNNNNLAGFNWYMPQLPPGGNYNFQALPGAMPQLPQGGNYNFQALPHAMPQVENYNMQVMQRAMPPLHQANATFQQLLGLQPQQPYSYYNTQPSQSSGSVGLPDMGWTTYQNGQLPSKFLGSQSSHQQDNPF